MNLTSGKLANASLRRISVPILYDRLHVLQYQMPLIKRSLLDIGTVTFSVDIDVGHEEVGLVNQGKNDRNVSTTKSERQIGRIEQTGLPLVLDVFDSFEVPATFAVRGQLFEVSPQTVEAITVRPIAHDIAGHGYYHRSFAALTGEESSAELGMLQNAMRKFGLQPESFVFPRNRIGHLDLLPSFGYLCFRGAGGFPNNRMSMDRVSGLWRLNPTLFVNSASNTALIEKIIDICSVHRAPAHFWFHIWNFGSDKSEMEHALGRVMRPLLAHISKLKHEGRITINSMKEVANKAERNQVNGVGGYAGSIPHSS